MRCSLCGKAAVFDDPFFCKDHFLRYVERKVDRTIRKFKLVTKKTNAVVAVSGGKDSLVTAYLLSKHCSVSLLAIDEGIAGYRAGTLKDLQKFNASFGPFPLKIISYQQEIGLTLDEMLIRKKAIPCSICGTFRRFMLNKYAQGFDVIATGHNLDDEAQAVMMNMLRGQTELLERIGVRTQEKDGLIVRVKPLYFCTEKEVLAYAFLCGMEIGFHECPHAPLSFRAQVRDALNRYEQEHPGTKQHIIESFLASRVSSGSLKRHRAETVLEKRFEKAHREMRTCKTCGFPSSKEECAACSLKRSLLIE